MVDPLWAAGVVISVAHERRAGEVTRRREG